MVEIKPIKSDSAGFTATERLFLTRDGKIVQEGDYRASMLLAPKGGVIPVKLAERIGLAKGIKIEPLERSPAKKTIAPEDIDTRSTRPEKPSDKR